MPDVRWSLAVALCLIYRALSSSIGPNEHKIHNIVLYPDKHSWCKTTEIKQIVAHPGCSSVEIDNNVCVGGCFSYSIPKTLPSAPGEEITPYCDTCQPTNFTWKEVKLTCQSDSEEEDTPAVEMIKKVQVITNCTCATCQFPASHGHHHKHSIGENKPDVPELLSMIKIHEKNQYQEADEDEEETEIEEEIDSTEERKHHATLRPPEKHSLDLENIIEVDEDKQKEQDESDGLGKEEDGVNKLEIVGVNHGSHLVVGPHHSLIVKPDGTPHLQHNTAVRHHKPNHDEEVPSLLENQFKIHDNEEYLDQIAVESRKEFSDKPLEVYTLPELIYASKLNDTVKSSKELLNRILDQKTSFVPEEKILRHQHHHVTLEKDEEEKIADAEEEHKGVKIVEVAHHHLVPAVEGTELSYIAKGEAPKSD